MSRLRTVIFILSVIFCGFESAKAGGFDIKGKSADGIRFAENKGQWEPQILFKADLVAGNLYMEKGGVTFQMWDGEALHESRHGHQKGNNLKLHASRIKYLGANLNPEVTAANADPDYRNYILGNDPSRWKNNVRLFHHVAYRNLWPLINVDWYGSAAGLKYDVHLLPGANPAHIQMKYEGVENLRIKNGELHYTTSLGSFTEGQPVAYQLINGVRYDVKCRYAVNKETNTVGFDFTDGYNAAYEVVIDPTLVFSSFTGSTADNFGFTATYDSLGNLYAGGIAFSFGYPITTGAYQTSFQGGNIDISISKFNPTGTNLVYSTYLGGTDNEQPSSLVVNHLNQLVILGTTASANYPVTGSAFDNTFNGGTFVNYPSNGVTFANGSDIVVTVLSATGGALAGSTFIGGSDNDGLNDALNLHYNYGDQFRGEVIVNEQNEIFVASCTRSLNFPVTGGAIQNALNGTHDACIFKLNPNCSQLLFCTYLGGSNADAGFGIKLDSAGLYVTGGTSSNDFPTTTGTIHPAYMGGVTDGFLVRLTAGGNQLLNATYLGTNAYDQSFFVEIDDDGDVYVTGQSLGNYPVTAGVYSNPNGRQFIHKLNSNLTATLYSTVFGSGSATTNISPTAFLVDVCENVYVSGWGGNVNQNAPDPTTQGFTFGMPVTADAYQPSTDGSDFYYIVLNKNAGSLLYATFFGGSTVSEHVDGGTSRFDRNGIVYQAMCAGCGSSDFTPTTPGVWSNTNNSNNCNLLGLKLAFDLAGTEVDIDASPRATGCVPLTVNFIATINNAQAFTWYLGDGTVSQQQNPVHTYNNVGVYQVMLVGLDSSSCNIVDTAYLEIEVRDDSLDANFLPNVQVKCDSNKVTLSASNYPSTNYSWSMGDGTKYTTSTVSHIYQTAGTKTVTLVVSDTSKCNLADTFTSQVFIPYTIDANFTPSDSFGCVPLALNFFTNQVATASYNWAFGDGTTSTQSQAFHTYSNAGTYPVRLIVTDTSSCNKADTGYATIVVIDSSADADFNFNRVFFGCDSVLVNVWSTYQGEESEVWYFGDGTQATGDSASHMYTTAGTFIITHVLTDVEQICKPVDTSQIAVSLFPLQISLAIPDTGGCLPFTADFTGNSALLSTDYTWYFGDGNSDTGKVTSHTYTTTGTFNVMLVAVDTNACVGADTTFAQITVINDSVIADFQLNVLNDCDSNLLIDLINQSINAVTYFWDFGDGTTSANANESHSYNIPGTYNVTLVVTDTNRCHPVDSMTVPVTLLPNAFVDFTTQDVCRGTAVLFNNLSNPNAQFVWSFGDGITSTQYSPAHNYTQSGVYNVSLVITDTATCNVNDTAFGSVEIFEQPIANFNVLDDTFLFETPVRFYDNSLYYSDLFWDFGDGSTLSNDVAPTHIYNSAIEWVTVCVTATNVQCADTFCRNIFIKFNGLIGVPNAFSPNGDGINDVVKIEGKGIVKLTFRIFNRWGEKVFETFDKNVGWDGVYKGVLQEMEVYTYSAQATLINGKDVSLKGNITLLR